MRPGGRFVDVRNGPKATNIRFRTTCRDMQCVDGSGLTREMFTSQAWSVQPRVRPADKVHVTAGHITSANRVPAKTPHSTMRWDKWGVLIVDRPALHYVSLALPRSSVFSPRRSRRCAGAAVSTVKGESGGRLTGKSSQTMLHPHQDFSASSTLAVSVCMSNFAMRPSRTVQTFAKGAVIGRPVLLKVTE